MVDEAQRRLRRKVVGGMLASILVLAALAFGAFWPAAVLGVNGEALQNSIDILGNGSCERLPSEQWRCYEKDSYFNDGFSYRVEVDGFGCWSAYGEEPGGKVSRGADRSGCVRLASYLP